MENLGAIQVWSPAAKTMISAGQVVNEFTTEFENAHIWRRNRTKMLRLHADQRYGLPSELLARVKPQIEQALNVDIETINGHREINHRAHVKQGVDSGIPVKENDLQTGEIVFFKITVILPPRDKIQQWHSNQ